MERAAHISVRGCRLIAKGIVSRLKKRRRSSIPISSENLLAEAAMPNPANSNPGHLEDEREQGRFEGSPLFLASDRRTFLQGAAATAVAGAANLSWHGLMNAAVAAADFDAIRAEIEKRHDEAVKRLQDWIRQPSIAAENRGMNEGCELTMRMLRDAGFQQATKIPTDGQPGIFAALDAGAPRTFGLYYMYDVKQADPAEWSSPPFEAALIDKPGVGKLVMGRGAVKKLPVNLVFVAEGEEEIGSPHFPQIVHRPEVLAALKNCLGVFMPSA